MDDKYKLLIKMKNGEMLKIKTELKTIEMLKKEEFSNDYTIEIENEKVRIKDIDYFAWSADIFSYLEQIS